MIDIDRLHDDEAYALKILIQLINTHFRASEEKIKKIELIASPHGCIPGRIIGNIFYGLQLTEEEERAIQEILNSYG